MGIYLFIGIIVTIVMGIILTAQSGWTEVVNLNTDSEDDLNTEIAGVFGAACIMVLVWPAVIIYAIYEFIKNKIES